MATTDENYFQKKIHEPIKNQLHKKLKYFLYNKLNEIYPEFTDTVLSDFILFDMPRDEYNVFTDIISKYSYNDEKIERILSANNLDDGIAEAFDDIRKKVEQSDCDYKHRENQKFKKVEPPLHLTKLHEFYKITHNPTNEFDAAKELQSSMEKITEKERHELNKDSNFLTRFVNAVSTFIKTHQLKSKAFESDTLHVLRMANHNVGRKEALLNFKNHEEKAPPSVNESSSSPSSNY